MKLKHTFDEMRNQSIVKAATELFLKNGYALTTMDDIATHAKITKQTVYARYPSKDALFTSMVNDLCERYTPMSMPKMHSEQPVDELLFQIGIRFVTLITSKEGVAALRLVVAEAQRYPKLAKHFYENGTQRIVAMIADVLKKKHIHTKLKIKNTESAASYFLALLKGRYYVRMVLSLKPDSSKKEKEKHVREVVQIFMKVYAIKNSLHTISVL